MNVYIWYKAGIVCVAKNEKRAVKLAVESTPPDRIIPCGPREEEACLMVGSQYELVLQKPET
jgi:hypothetical protein